MDTLFAIALIVVCIFAISGLEMLIEKVFPPKPKPRDYETHRSRNNNP